MFWLSLLMFLETGCGEEANDHVLPDCQWNGILGRREVHTQRLSCQKLHVRLQSFFFLYPILPISPAAFPPSSHCPTFSKLSTFSHIICVFLSLSQDWRPFCHQDCWFWSLRGCVCEELLQTRSQWRVHQTTGEMDGARESEWRSVHWEDRCCK